MKSVFNLFFYITALACLTSGRNGYAQSAGSIDPTFDPIVAVAGGGVFTRQPNGQIIVQSDTGIERLDVDGHLDTGFVFDSGIAGDASLTGTVSQPDGKFFVGGRFTIAGRGSTIYGLARISADGSVDTTFAPFQPPFPFTVGSTVVQPDGKIIFSLDGSIELIGRLNADGSPDAGFNQATRIETAFSGENVVLCQPVIQPDGKIIIGGTFMHVDGVSCNNIARLNADGSLDTSFMANVYRAYQAYDGLSYISDVALQADNKIVVSGEFDFTDAGNREYVARFNADGSIDSSFNPNIEPEYGVTALAIQPDGKIVIAGTFLVAFPGTIEGVSLARLNTDGSLDTGFAFGTESGLLPPAELYVQPSGKIVVSGSFNTIDGSPRNGIARLYGADVIPVPVITSAPSATGNVGEIFSYQITATNSPTSFAVSNLPNGLYADSVTGLISGTPTQTGSFSVALSAANAGGLGVATLTLMVSAEPVVTLVATTPTVTVGGADAAEFTLSLSAPPTSDLTISFTIKGTATNGTDYVLIKTTKKIKAGHTSKPIKIEPLGDLGGASKKTVKLVLEPGTGYTAGTAGKVKVSILAVQ